MSEPSMSYQTDMVVVIRRLFRLEGRQSIARRGVQRNAWCGRMAGICSLVTIDSLVPEILLCWSFTQGLRLAPPLALRGCASMHRVGFA
jgi:hypothetical protein